MSWPILSVLIWLPIVGGIAVMLLGSERAQFGKQVALGTSIVTFALSVPLWTGFDINSASMQFVENVPWIERFSAFYALGVDGISMPLVLLTTGSFVLVYVLSTAAAVRLLPRESWSRRSAALALAAVVVLLVMTGVYLWWTAAVAVAALAYLRWRRSVAASADQQQDAHRGIRP